MPFPLREGLCLILRHSHNPCRILLYPDSGETHKSVIEDTRKLIQDFLAPELREIATRLNALETRLDDRFRVVDDQFKMVDDRFAAAERLASERHQQVLLAISRLADVYELKERVARIEARERAS